MLNKYVLSIIAALCSAFLLAAYIPYKGSVVSAFGSSKMAQKLALSTKAIHDDCLARIKAEFAITDEIWAEFMGRFHDLIKADDLLGSSAIQPNDSDHAYIVMAQRLLLEYGVNLEKVTVKLIDAASSPSLVIQELSDDNSKIIHSIGINIPLMNRYTKEMQEALLRHEIMHLLNYDSIEGSFVIGMLNKCGYSAQVCDNSPAIIAYRQQRELRADALASCDRPEVAQALQSDFKRSIPQQDQENPALWKFHPSSQKRYDQLAQLLIDMGHQQEQTTSIA